MKQRRVNAVNMYSICLVLKAQMKDCERREVDRLQKVVLLVAVSELMFFHIGSKEILSYHVLAYISPCFTYLLDHGVSGSNEYLLNSQKLTFSTDRS